MGRRPDAIALSGGLAYSGRFVRMVRERVEWIAPLHTFPDEDELDALVGAVLPALTGEREIKTY
jgi:butyrate kinase